MYLYIYILIYIYTQIVNLIAEIRKSFCERTGQPSTNLWWPGQLYLESRPAVASSHDGPLLWSLWSISIVVHIDIDIDLNSRYSVKYYWLQYILVCHSPNRILVDSSYGMYKIPWYPMISHDIPWYPISIDIPWHYLLGGLHFSVPAMTFNVDFRLRSKPRQMWNQRKTACSWSEMHPRASWKKKPAWIYLRPNGNQLPQKNPKTRAS